jgi:hypothetical protein
MIEVIGKRGLLTFDGRVIEIFGFERPESKRIHIQQLKKLEKKSDKGKTNLFIYYDYGMRGINCDNCTNLDEFIAAVVAASDNPDLELNI